MNDKPEYFTKLESNIDTHGFHVTYVHSEIPYSYTVGMLKSFGIPELIISSLPPNLSHELTTQYMNRHRGQVPPLNRVIEKHDERFDYILIAVENSNVEDYALSTFRYFQADQIEFVQLIFPDAKSRFPHQSGYDYDQEILGQYPNTIAG